MALRPDWPVIDEAVSFTANVGTPVPYPYWLSVAGRTKDQSQSRRGRADELNIVQTGEYTVTLSNTDGVFSPMNTGSPYASALKPNVPYRRRAQWPPTVQLLTQTQANGGAPGYAARALINSLSTNQVFSAVDANAQSVASPTGFTGAIQVYQVTVPNSAALTSLWYVSGFSVFQPVPPVNRATPLSWQVWARAAVGASTLSVAPFILWVDCTGATISTAIGSTVVLPAASASWVNIPQANVTTPATAIGALAGLVLIADPSVTVTLQVGGAQLEQSSTCSSFILPGVWY